MEECNEAAGQAVAELVCFADAFSGAVDVTCAIDKNHERQDGTRKAWSYHTPAIVDDDQQVEEDGGDGGDDEDVAAEESSVVVAVEGVGDDYQDTATEIECGKGPGI